jgi:two-component system, cell cycle response regulator DivK
VANELILVVEDNDKNRKLVRDVLTFKGYEIIEAETGKRVSASPKSATRAWS